MRNTQYSTSPWVIAAAISVVTVDRVGAVFGKSAEFAFAYGKRLFHMLGEISSAEDADGRGMLTVVVVHKVGDMQPGPGFFELAKSLGRDTGDILKCWVAELHKVHAYWSGK